MSIAPDAGFVRNQWYVIAWAKDVGQALSAWKILGRPVVMFRRDDGQVVALEDICPHRWMPLSKGERAGDDIICGYHGHRFNARGECVSVPSQPGHRYSAKVRSYPIVEQGPLIWIWTGDPAHAANQKPPETPELLDRSFRWAIVRVDIDANYLLMHENTLDQTHFHTLHRNFAATPEWDLGEIGVEIVGEQIVRTHVVRDTPAPPVAAFAGIAPGTKVDSRSTGVFVQAGLNVSRTTHVNSETGYAGTLVTYHVFTPVDASQTHYSIAVGTPFADADMSALEAGVLKATLEDKSAVEAVQHVATKYSPEREASVAADYAGLQARRLIRLQLERQSEAQNEALSRQ